MLINQVLVDFILYTNYLALIQLLLKDVRHCIKISWIFIDIGNVYPLRINKANHIIFLVSKVYKEVINRVLIFYSKVLRYKSRVSNS
jgi:hypothetical protein